ncbi:MAG: hypothetical protein KGJ78_16590 [Alphaproteobacteria bacterium]|nr:hypothetical protein [Alphaproteobacteria bacterium]
MITDPKLLVVGLCFLVLSTIAALALKYLHGLRERRAAMGGTSAPRAAMAGVQPRMAMGMRWAESRMEAGLPASSPRPMAAFQTNIPRAQSNGGRKVIPIIHDFGHPHGHQTDERRYLSTREAFEILAEIRSVSADTPIDFVLHTPGGEGFACELIASAVKDRPNTTAYVPYCAMSAGTIIALSTEKVVMGKYACLGPIDTQFFGFPIESFARLLHEKPIANVDDFTVLLAYLAEKELKTARQRACELLNKHHFGHDDACQLTDFLVAGDMPHSEQISRDRAVQLGVNIVDGECPSAVYDLVEERLRIYRSMDEQAGFAAEFAARPVSALEDKRASFVAPPVMWRKG